MANRILTRRLLDDQGCGVPDCEHDHSKLYLTPLCHPKAGLAVMYNKTDGALVITCAKCESFVGRVAVAQSVPDE
jgi:hypothetical protein